MLMKMMMIVINYWMMEKPLVEKIRTKSKRKKREKEKEGWIKYRREQE